MITREEFDFNFNRLGYVGKAEVAKLYINSLEQHIKSLEAQLANTGQLTCESCVFCGEDCAVLEMIIAQFGFEVENCICPNHTQKDTQ